MKYHVRYIYWKLNLALILLSIIFALPASAGINFNYTAADGTPRNYTINTDVDKLGSVSLIDGTIEMPSITLSFKINKALVSGSRSLVINGSLIGPKTTVLPKQKLFWADSSNNTAVVSFIVDASSTSFANTSVNISTFKQVSNNVPFFSDFSIAVLNFNDLKNTWNNDTKVLDEFITTTTDATKINETTVMLNSTGDSGTISQNLPSGNYLILVTKGTNPKEIIASNIVKVLPFSGSPILVGDASGTAIQGQDLVVSISLNHAAPSESYTYITSIIDRSDYADNLGNLNINWSSGKTLAQATKVNGKVLNDSNFTDIIPRSNTTRITNSSKSAILTLKTGALPAGSYFVHTVVFNSTNLLVAFNQSTLTLTPAVAVGAPNITSFAPSTPASGVIFSSTKFNITVNQTVNVSWYFNSNPEQTNTSVLANTSVNYTRSTNLIGVHNVTAIATNANGTATQKWKWNVTTTEPYFAIGSVAVNQNESGIVPLYLNNSNKTGSFDVNVTFNSSIANVIAIAKGSAVEHLEYNITTGMARIGGFNLNASLSGNVKLADITLSDIGRQGSSTVLGITVNSLADENVTKDPKNVTGIGVQQGSFGIRDTKKPNITSVGLNRTSVFASEPILVTVNANDNVGVTSVIASDGVSPINLSLATGSASSGIWQGVIIAQSSLGVKTVSVIAYDAEGNSGTNSTQYTVVTYGTLSGTVLSSADNQPINEAIVFADTTNATTDVNGAYLMILKPGSYNVIATKPGYAVNTTTAVVNSNERTTRNFVLDTVVLSADALIKAAPNDTNVTFNLNATNYGANATYTVDIKGNVSYTILDLSPPFTVNGSETKRFRLNVSNPSVYVWPMTVNVSNATQGKYATLTLYAVMRDVTADYTNISSFVVNSIVTNATLINSTVTNNSNVTGDTTILWNSSVNNSNITDSTLFNSTVDTTTVVNTTLFDVEIINSGVIRDIVLRNIRIIDVPRITGKGDNPILGKSNGRVSYPFMKAGITPIDFTRIHKDKAVRDLIRIRAIRSGISGTIIDDNFLGGKFDMNLTLIATNLTLDIARTGLNPEGVGIDENVTGSRIINDYLRINTSGISNVNYSNLTLRLYYTGAEASGLENFAVYLFNSTTNKWEKLDTVGSGTEAGRNYIEVRPPHLSTFAIAGTLVAAPSVPTDGDGAGDGGTGGGGVVTSEPFDNIAKYETRSKDLIANTPITYIFTVPEHGIYEIVLTGKESENDIALRVEALKGTSKLVTASAPGAVYKNVNIWAGTKKIKEVLIRFRVENSWITGSNQDSGDVKMLRWDGSKWTQLETIEKTRDNTYTYYEAKTNTLSQFAIAGLKGVVVPTVTPTVTVPAVTPTVTPTVTVTPPVPKPPGIPAWVYAIIAIVIIAAAVYFLVIKKKEEKK